MMRPLILFCANLAFAPGVLAASPPTPRVAPGAFSRSPSVRASSRSPAPQPRGGPGTLGGYLQRPPSSDRFRYPDGSYRNRYLGSPYYDPFYFDPFYGDAFYYDPFFTDSRGYGSRGYRSDDEWSKQGNVQFRVSPKDVEVIVDGIPSAKGGRAVLDLPSGMHYIEIRRSGYRTWSTDLDVKQGIRYRLEQRLEREEGKSQK